MFLYFLREQLKKLGEFQSVSNYEHGENVSEKVLISQFTNKTKTMPYLNRACKYFIFGRRFLVTRKVIYIFVNV